MIIDFIRRLFSRLIFRSSIGCREINHLSDDANDLFRRIFKTPAPTDGRHFIIEFSDLPNISRPRLLGYVNFRPYQNGYLAGGLVVDVWRYRDLSRKAQLEIKRHGGMAEWLMRHAVRSVSPCTAVYAYIGDKISEIVNIRVGFKKTSSKYLFIYCIADPNQADVHNLTQAVAALGPF